MSTPHDGSPPGEQPRARAPSAGRRRQQRRIAQATRALAVGGVAATAAFALAAAHSGGQSGAATGQEPSSAGEDTGLAPLTALDEGATDDGADDGSVITPSQSTPTPTYAPPVAQSGGS